MGLKPVVKISRAVSTLEGAGVRLKRAFGFYDTARYDPFLLLDDFRSDDQSDYDAGFPWHPHRGIQTVTYMLEGWVDHEDSLGNKGTIGPGGVQWMTSGSGIIHQEMPRGDQKGRMYGFQLWVNLPAVLKTSDPEYQEFVSDEIPAVTELDGTIVKVICGKFSGVSGPVSVTGGLPSYFDVNLPPQTEKTFDITPEHNVIVYVYKGTVELSPDEAAENLDLVLFGEGESIKIKSGKTGAGILLLSGIPLRESVAWRGPIVMNTQEELDTAFVQLREGTFLKK